MAPAATLTENITAYEAMQNTLEADHWAQYVVFYNEQLQGSFDEFQPAIEFAAERWGHGPYLIRQVGRPPFVTPASVQYRPIDA